MEELLVRTDLSRRSTGDADACLVGSPAQMTRGTEEMLNLDDSRAPRRKNTAGDQSMRRSIQDLVSSIDPSVKIEPDVEDVSFRPETSHKL